MRRFKFVSPDGSIVERDMLGPEDIAPVQLPACRHIGLAVTGDRVPCACGPRTSLKVFACTKHGRCTPEQQSPGVACCATCQDRDPLLLQLVVNGSGIGDCVLGMVAVAGLRRANPGADITYVVQEEYQIAWADCFADATRTRTNALSHPAMKTHDLSDYSIIDKQDWSRRCGVEPALPSLRRIPGAPRRWAERFRGYVVLAPWSVYPVRTYLLSHWLRLEQLLIDDGLRPVVLDGHTDDKGRAGAFRSEVVRDPSPWQAVALLKEAACLVGCDSGPMHVAGALGAPGVALVALLNPDEIFRNYPSVRVVPGKLGCTGCNGGGEHWRDACNSLCASLAAVQPEDVMGVIRQVIAKKT